MKKLLSVIALFVCFSTHAQMKGIVDSNKDTLIFNTPLSIQSAGAKKYSVVIADATTTTSGAMPFAKIQQLDKATSDAGKALSDAAAAKTAAGTAQTGVDAEHTVNVSQAQAISNLLIVSSDHDSQIDGLQTQINNIVIPVGTGILPTRTISQSETLLDTDFNKEIFINCSCIIKLPALPDGWNCNAWRTSGTPTFVNANGTQIGTIAVKGGMVHIAYQGANNPKISVR